MLAPLQPLQPRPRSESGSPPRRGPAPTASAAFRKRAIVVNVKKMAEPRLEASREANTTAVSPMMLLQQKSTRRARRALYRQRGATPPLPHHSGPLTAGAGHTREYAHVRCYELHVKVHRCTIDAGSMPFRSLRPDRPDTHPQALEELAWGNRIHTSAHQNHIDPKAAKRTRGQEEGAASAKKNGSICVARERGLLKLPSPFYSALLSALLML
jgi:hypothetical protein